MEKVATKNKQIRIWPNRDCPNFFFKYG